MSKEAEILRKCVSCHDKHMCQKPIKELEGGDHVSQVCEFYKKMTLNLSKTTSL